MESRRPVPGTFYRHFKNKIYQIIGIAKDSETKEEMVVYQALYDDFGMYVRPLTMFTSEVDHEKYPYVTQKYRFEEIPREKIWESVDTGYNVAANGVSDAAKQHSGEKMSAMDVQVKAGKTEDVTADSEEKPSPVLMQFLDMDTYEEKLEFLKNNKIRLDDSIIDAMAASLDVIVPEGSLDERYASLKSCVSAHAKYECTRLR